VTPERAIASCSTRSNSLEPGVSTTGARWTPADAALACSRYIDDGRIYELHNVCMYAFRYRWARDDSVLGSLRSALLMEAIDLRFEEGWPKFIRRLDLNTGQWAEGKYVEDLVDLALLEEHNGWMLRKLDLWGACLGVYPNVWRRVLSPRYEAIRQVLEVWCGTARSHMSRRLR